MILKNFPIFFHSNNFSPLKFSHSRIVSNFIFKFHHQNFVIAYFVFVVLAMFFLSTILFYFFVKFYPNESIFKIIIIFIKFFTKIIFNSFNIFILIYLKNEKLIFFLETCSITFQVKN